MKARTNLSLGLITAIVGVIFCISVTITSVMLFCFSQGERLFFGGILLLDLIALFSFVLYIFALVKKHLSIAKWLYPILVFCVIYLGGVPIFQALFIIEFSDVLAVYPIPLILIISLVVVLLLFSLGLGISGLRSTLEEQGKL